MNKVFTVRNGKTGESQKVSATQIDGGSEWQAQCPFHQSDGLTLKINAEKMVWQCMSCQATGKVVGTDDTGPDSAPPELPVTDEFDWDHPRREHIYRSETGEPLHKTVVYPYKNNTKKKECIPHAYVNGRWEKGLTKKDEQGNSIPHSYKVRLVPYNLDKIVSQPDKPIFINEGEKDCDSMDSLSHGIMVATTNCLGAGKWKEEYNQYLRYRDVYLLPDHDKAGYKHMRQVGEAVRKVAKSVKLILLPGLQDNGSKDFSDWIADGHTLEEFEQLVKNAPEFDSKLLSKYDPYEPIDFNDTGSSTDKTSSPAKHNRLSGDQLADFILEDKFTSDGTVTLKYHGGMFSLFTGKYYHVYDREKIRSFIDTYLRQELPQKRGISVPISNILKEELIKSIQDRQSVHLGSDVKLPYWQGDNPPSQGLLLVVNNGILALEELLGGGEHHTDNVLFPHNPRLFSTSCLPYDYDPEAQCPKWFRFLDETFPDDPDSIAFLQEWFGYNLSNENNQKAFLVIEGPTNSGKSVITNVLTALLGEQNVSHIPLIDFKKDFKLVGIYGKMANICAEVRSTGTACEQMLKCITGGDMIELDVKFGPPIRFLPTAKITFTTNEHPHWDEKSGALYSRLKVLRCDHSVPEDRQNKHLTNELKEELAGIFNWAVQGLKGLNTNQSFTVSQRSREAVAQHRKDSDSAWAFAAECLVCREDDRVKIDDLYGRYKVWALSEGFRSPLKKAKFCEVLMEHFPNAVKRRLGPVSDRQWCLIGVGFCHEHGGGFPSDNGDSLKGIPTDDHLSSRNTFAELFTISEE